MHATQYIWTPQSGWSGAQDDERADLVLAFGSSKAFADGAQWQALKERHPGAIVMGCSTGGEIHGCEVMDESLAATVISFEHTKLTAAEASVDAEGGSFAVGKALGGKLASPDLKALFVLSDGTKVNGSELVRGLRSVIGADVILTGGLAGDGADFGTTYVGLDGKPEPGKVAAIGFHGEDLLIGHGSFGGWDVFGPERHITKSSANVLFELDGVPALDLYKRYLGEEAAQLPGSALLFPLRIYPADKPEQALVRTIVGIDETAKSMVFAGDMPQGYRAQLMRGNLDRLIEGAATAAEQADIHAQGDSVAILVSCIGRKLLLGSRTREEVEAVKDVLGPNIRMTGFYSYGEVCPHHLTGSAELHNQTMTITTLGERKLA
jgi:hypothetical protein